MLLSIFLLEFLRCAVIIDMTSLKNRGENLKLLPVIMSAFLFASAKSPAVFESDRGELPQSVLHDIVMDYLSDNTGEQDKKLLFIGYDGFRRDCLPIILSEPDGGASRVMSKGRLLWSYAGGDRKSPQQTSTAVGWSTILTGKPASESGVWNNKSVKRDSAETFLTKAAAMGYSCAFISSYHSHFDSTFARDIRKAEKDESGCVYIQTASDSESLDTARRLFEDGTTDVVFVIFEYTDSAGHSSGFSYNEPAYAEACRAADRAGAELISAADSADGEKVERMIVISTDHGGIGRRHGGQSDDERHTWALVGK